MANAQATNQTILVVGGGMSGITAALEAAETGYDVVLVEKEPLPGGAGRTAAPIFPQTVPSVLWAGDQFQADEAEPEGTVFHHGRSDRRLRAERRL